MLNAFPVTVDGGQSGGMFEKRRLRVLPVQRKHSGGYNIRGSVFSIHLLRADLKFGEYFFTLHA